MKFKSLTGKLVFVGIIALLFTSFYVSAEHIFTRHIRGEATRINMAGHLRFRSFRIAWLLHRMVENKRPELRETVIDEIKAFESIAGRLRSGSKDIGVRPVTDMEEMKVLDGILNNWNGRIKPMVLNVLEDPDYKATATLDRYDLLVNDYVSDINGFVGLLEEHFKDQIGRFDIFRVYALGLFIVVFSFIALYIRRGIIKPLDAVFETTEAISNGEFKRRLDIRTGDEIEKLAGSINNMALGIEGAITNLEGLVKQRTEEMEAANEELKSLDRLKADFLCAITHELRSPLSPILGYLELLRDGGIGDMTSKQQEVIAEMHICGKHMQLLIDELLEVASIQSGAILLDFKEVDLYPILIHAVKDVREYAEEVSTEIEIRVPEDPVLLVGDRKSLSGIFTHLLRNAVKFSPQFGKVKMEVKGRDNGVEVAISDNGIGIPKDKLDKIFDVFYQIDSSRARRYEGIGLGLYLVKKLVDLHKGSIRVESKEGEGTVFHVFIPKGVETQNVASLSDAKEVLNG